MSEATDRDYVLGTHDEEIERLGLQHRIWRDTVLEGWRLAGIGAGSRVLETGCGPGFATLDLAATVGPSGRVLAIDRSTRFLDHARAACRRRGFGHVELREADLDRLELEPLGFDAAYCRWVAAFVTRPERLVAACGRALRAGGVAVFHEYVDYASWKLSPPRPAFDAFVAEVMASWREAGGEPDIARALPAMLLASGFRITRLRPLVFASVPGDAIWPWPAAFVDTGVERLPALGRVTPGWAASVASEYREASADPATVMITPIVLEIAAERVG